MVQTIPFHVEQLFGGALLGNIICAVFFGILTVQVVFYYGRFPHDSKWTWRAVGFLWLLILTQVIMVTRVNWRWQIENYSNLDELQQGKWQLVIYQLFASVTSVTVQTFFVYRIWSLSSSICAAAPVQVFSLAQFAFGIALQAKADMSSTFAEIVQKWDWIATAWLVMQAVCDASIAVLMTSLLWYRKTGFRKTDSAINTIIYWAIATGSITCVQSITGLVAFARSGFSHLTLIMGITFSCMYPLCMLTNLHMRSRVRKKLTAPTRGSDKPSIPLDALTSARRRAVIAHERGQPMPQTRLGNVVINFHRSRFEDNHCSVSPFPSSMST
ncbi:uncharacterized protein EI90DRAFT_1226457 [Cantharellus anzutake]|uniref:uncharacterized protein n=1 Tax=Cantharellus anzutake TaxID=1750568 RepID=UPI001907086E|nr:uncharacterized protein EI90DRAFT_2474352 [Cantharellus anzutake]XP_038915325.1 uncharacterized protein EI90DRAFT_1226457 [Cantharellus anzutake]KAF8322769.1 hypothetical protein EI90DRAFT_2474352 [Cantharellus anzutake]KAF8330146.1 hypothetical protein EI90DRAFT_1226457 [Cantharellus anzutake]